MLRISLCFVVAFLAFLSPANGQDCIPMSVTNINLTFTGILTWSIREEETCPVTHFMVHMSEPNEEARFIMKSFTTRLNIDYLMSCEEWHLNIIPYSNETKGDDHLYITQIPVPMDADLSIRFINVTRPEEEGDLHLQWEMNSVVFGNCSLRYRVTVAGDDDDVIHDTYMHERQMNLHFLSPCVNYEFGVRVVNIAPPVMEGPLRAIEYEYPPAVQSPPNLLSANAGATSINLTYSLETFRSNQCPIRELQVKGGAYFNVTVPLHDSEEREPIEVQITNLLPNSMYLLRTSVQNSAGWSNPSVVAVQTLDLAPN
ncbi:hypothetical protein NQ315_001363 [Exocentrus adspersus]|uniref:Fibronectin type-III domain-containing protein n=1 Tax=Exocentrus adspersus TaxID=1586481 RepID=A0AAV8WF38_9CUCU|nr:hypothetical protein NQ315_001363 [Exocentrus adspersus]